MSETDKIVLGVFLCAPFFLGTTIYYMNRCGQARAALRQEGKG